MAEGKRAQPKWQVPDGTFRTGLKVANSLVLDELVEFVPKDGRRVGYYVCGPTVYNSSHLGHARNYVTFDVIRRIMSSHFGYDMFVVMNITDVDDKIILKARKDHLFRVYASENPKLSDSVLQFVRTAIDKEVASCEAKMADLDTNTDKSEAERVGEKKLLEKRVVNAKAIFAGEGAKKYAVGADSAPLLDVARDAVCNELDATLKDTVKDLDVTPVSSRYEAEFLEDMTALGVQMPDVLTRVSEYVPQVIEYIEKIIANGYGYESNGSVYFDTEKYLTDGHHDYGKLAPSKVGNTARAQEEADGALSAGTSDKKNANDFVLWKNSKPGEPVWKSPWGQGRPGWHIECSAMASDLIGMTLDVHGGGQDLFFPHHENEIAQCEAYFHDQGCKQWVNYFLHSGHLHIDGLKMSKSLKNFITIREALAQYSAKQLRLFFVTRNWNKEVNFDKSTMEEVFAMERSFDSFFAAVASVTRASALADAQRWSDAEKTLNDKISETASLVHAAYCDNFDTRTAINALLALAKSVNLYLQDASIAVKKAFLLQKAAALVTQHLRVLGLVPQGDALGWMDTSGGGGDDALIGAFYEFRQGVRSVARNKEENASGKLMALTDNLRDNVLPTLGLKFDDGDLGWKRVDAKQAMQEMQERKQLERTKLEKKLAAAKNDLENLQRQSKPATSTIDAAEFGAFDEQGYPTKLADGSDIPKNRQKTLKKAWTAQEKAHTKYLEKTAKAGKDLIEAARARIQELEAQIGKL